MKNNLVNFVHLIFLRSAHLNIYQCLPIFAWECENRYFTCNQARTLCIFMTSATVEARLTNHMFFIVLHYFIRI